MPSKKRKPADFGRVHCKSCGGTGKIDVKKGYEIMVFVVPRDTVEMIEAELERVGTMAELTTDNIAVRRGLALNLAMALSSTTPLESLQ